MSFEQLTVRTPPLTGYCCCEEWRRHKGGRDPNYEGAQLVDTFATSRYMPGVLLRTVTEIRDSA